MINNPATYLDMDNYRNLIIKVLTESQPLTAKEIALELGKKNHFQKTGNPISESQIRRVIRSAQASFIQNTSHRPFKYSLQNNHSPALSSASRISNELGFLNWLKINQKQISRPDKYVGAMKTISNNLITDGIIPQDVWAINSIDELNNLHKLYFNIPTYKTKNNTGNNMYSRAFDLYLEYSTGSSSAGDVKAILDIALSNNLNNTEKEILISARIGQGKFRNDLIKVWGSCAISGFNDTSLLVASHIKPWAKSNNVEKLDAYNGLLLLPTYDKLFDKGLISFDENGVIIISPYVSDYESLHLRVGIKIQLKKASEFYMNYHRNNVFKK
ncbi:HNH endonuclease [Pedobacter ghigonis]|uniref:HNH endonuclease n=1 Tax=Pedobacter ghigonis TaxID=2730403 RepID=UPI00158922BA|nr:HNH endonuclease signature motif containing protein [Pedobacter ghigonis]